MSLMYDNIEVLCLEGLEEALIGVQVRGDGQQPTLVYDYKATLRLLAAAGYEKNEIQGFLKDLANVDFVAPPIFVALDMNVSSQILRGDRYYFDDGNHTLH